MQNSDIRFAKTLPRLSDPLWIVAIVGVITFFVNNCVVTPDIMECRNIVTAREMVYDGNWIVTTMNGELRLEKPPLPTWLTAVAEMVAPGSLALQRGMAGVAAMMLVAYFWLFARRVMGIGPLAPTLILLTCYNIVLMGRTASWDIYTHAFMMGAIYHLAMALGKSSDNIDAPPRWRHFLMAGLMAGLSIMSKGPVSLYALLLPFVVVYCLVWRPSIKGKGTALSVMVAIALVVGSWWYLYIYATCGDALSAVVGKESGSWLRHSVRPWWYYWKFFLEAGVWALLLLTSIFLPMASEKRRKSREWLLPVAWMAGSLALLSLLPEKKSRYLLPLCIPASLCMGVVVTWWTERFKGIPSLLQRRSADARLMRANAVAIAIAVAVVPVAAYHYLVGAGSMSMAQWALLLTVCVAVAVYIDMAALQLKPMRVVGAVTFLFVTAETLFLPCIKAVVNNPAMRSVALIGSDEATASLPLYHDAQEELRIEVVYAAGKRIGGVDIGDADALADSMPCILLTHTPHPALPPQLTQKADTASLGRFDDNRWAEGHKLYRQSLINYATLIEEKRDNK